MATADFVGEFELCVLLAVAHLGPGAYGVTVGREIAARTGRRPTAGAVYATLGRLTEKGLVAVQRSGPRPVRGGRSRNTVALTPAGDYALEATATMLTRMMAGWVSRAGRM